MAATVLQPPPASRPAGRVPRLENGDRLNRVEFERRYAAMPQVKKAELIEGTVVMPAPVRFSEHAVPHADVIAWLGWYKAATPGVALADNATVRLDQDNEPQPDALLRILPRAGGQSRDSADGYLEGAPELVAEVAATSASYDLHEKRRVYRRNGVREYFVWLVEDARLEWWELRDSEYVALPFEEGLMKSRAFPGLWLDAAALLSGRSEQVLAQFQRGIASADHAAFVSDLRSRLGA